MRRRPATAWLALCLALTLPTAAEGQRRPRRAPSGCGSSFWWPCVDSIGVGLASREQWRGYDLGTLPARGDLSVTVLGGRNQDVVQLVLDAAASAPLMNRDRIATTDLLAASLRLQLRTDDNDSRVWVGGGGYAFPGRDGGFAAGRGSMGELAAGLQQRIPWLPERPPLLLAQVAWDSHRVDATYARLGLDLDYALNPFGIFLIPALSWSDLPTPDGTARAFAYHGWEVGMIVSFDSVRTRLGRLRLEGLASVEQAPRAHRGASGSVGVRALLLPQTR